MPLLLPVSDLSRWSSLSRIAKTCSNGAVASRHVDLRIVESGSRLNIPRMFAALLLLSALGIIIFMVC